METPKKVTWSANALLMVSELFDYLTETISEYFADGYIDELLEFGESLAYKSEHHSYCRNIKLQEKQYRCALFKRKYILIYSTAESEVLILAVIHAKRNPKDFENY